MWVLGTYWAKCLLNGQTCVISNDCPSAHDFNSSWNFIPKFRCWWYLELGERLDKVIVKESPWLPLGVLWEEEERLEWVYYRVSLWSSAPCDAGRIQMMSRHQHHLSGVLASRIISQITSTLCQLQFQIFPSSNRKMHQGFQNQVHNESRIFLAGLDILHCLTSQQTCFWIHNIHAQNCACWHAGSTSAQPGDYSMHALNCHVFMEYTKFSALREA